MDDKMAHVDSHFAGNSVNDTRPARRLTADQLDFTRELAGYKRSIVLTPTTPPGVVTGSWVFVPILPGDENATIKYIDPHKGFQQMMMLGRDDYKRFALRMLAMVENASETPDPKPEHPQSDGSADGPGPAEDKPDPLRWPPKHWEEVKPTPLTGTDSFASAVEQMARVVGDIDRRDGHLKTAMANADARAVFAFRGKTYSNAVFCTMLEAASHCAALSHGNHVDGAIAFLSAAFNEVVGADKKENSPVDDSMACLQTAKNRACEEKDFARAAAIRDLMDRFKQTGRPAVEVQG